MNNQSILRAKYWKIFLLSCLSCACVLSVAKVQAATGQLSPFPLYLQQSQNSPFPPQSFEIRASGKEGNKGGHFPDQLALATPDKMPELPLNELQELEENAQHLYETGRFVEAIALLQRLATTYASQGDHFRQGMAWRNLALVYHQLGERPQAQAAITESLSKIQQVENSGDRAQLSAQILEVQGQLQLSGGQAEAALETWKKAAENYQEIGDMTGVTRSKINQSQALQTLGLYAQAVKTLQAVKDTLQNQPDTLLKAQEFQSLGEALRVVGNLNQAQEVLQQSLAIAEKLPSHETLVSTLISLGNTARTQDKSDAALNFYQRAIAASTTPEMTLEAQLNQLSLLIEQKQWQEATVLVAPLQRLVAKLPASRSEIYARINLAGSLRKMGEKGTEQPSKITSYQDAAQILATAVQQAKSLQDQRAEAYALGNLGRLYEQNQQWDDARKLTEKALLLAEAVNAADIAYQWQWQLGRILKAQGDREGAIASYSQAVNTLQSLRTDLVSISSDVQFSFRESVEPVYRELVSLLLQPPLTGQGEIQQSALIEARQLIESLQVAELDNFFRDACLNVRPIQIDQLDPKAAVFYPIILSDRLELIVKLPGQKLRHYAAKVSEKELETTIREMREALTSPQLRLAIETFWESSKKVYNWLIQPIETDLAASGAETLVFVLDGVLRNLPMATLYNGEQYLAQKYSIAVAPGLQLIDAKPLARNQLKILAVGLSESRQGFNALPGVESELQRIGTVVPRQELLNQAFTELNLKAAVNSFSFPVVHLATHGQFSSQAENTFILAWDSRINAKELDSLLRGNSQRLQPIELLVLSACRTAFGDKRAALGLAGVAVRAGARSTLASLWYVSDEATALLMTRFYQELAKDDGGKGVRLTKAEALRRAQQSLLEDERFSHPYYWAAFVLVGNWL